MRDRGRRLDEFPFPELQRSFSAFKIHAERRVNRLRHPVEGYIRQQFVGRESAVHITVAIGPFTKLFQNPGSQTDRRIIKPISSRLRARSLEMSVGAAFINPLTDHLKELFFRRSDFCAWLQKRP